MKVRLWLLLAWPIVIVWNWWDAYDAEEKFLHVVLLILGALAVVSILRE